MSFVNEVMKFVNQVMNFITQVTFDNESRQLLFLKNLVT